MWGKWFSSGCCSEFVTKGHKLKRWNWSRDEVEMVRELTKSPPRTREAGWMVHYCFQPNALFLWSRFAIPRRDSRLAANNEAGVSALAKSRLKWLRSSRSRSNHEPSFSVAVTLSESAPDPFFTAAKNWSLYSTFTRAARSLLISRIIS
jgi:hypothetical protein